MKRSIGIGTCLVVLTTIGMVAGPAGPAGAHLVEDNLPGGTSIAVSIDSPADGAVLPTGPVTVTGTAEVGMGAPIANTALVYVVDVSGSTAAVSDCPANGDTVLDCEVAAAIALNQEAIALQTVGAVGAVAFGTDAAATDVRPAPGVDLITGPDTDDNSANGPDVEEVLATATIGGITDFTPPAHSLGAATAFADAIQAATTVATDPANTMDQTAVAFLSDGMNNGPDIGPALAAVPEDVAFHTFAIGSGSQCVAPQNSLQEIADETGGTCTEVSDVAELPDFLPGVIASELASLTLEVNGGTGIPITDTTPALPQEGPASVDYTVETDPLGPGTHELCVTASGSDGGGAGEVTDCHTITILAPGEAFAISASGLVTIPKTPHATCPPDETLTQAALNAGIATLDALNASCTTDEDTAETLATASIDAASLLGGVITISNIESTCEAGPSGLTGSSRVGTINGTPIGQGSGSITIPLVATIHYNETTTNAQGQLVQNAIRVQTILGQQIILAGCRLG